MAIEEQYPSIDPRLSSLEDELDRLETEECRKEIREGEAPQVIDEWRRILETATPELRLFAFSRVCRLAAFEAADLMEQAVAENNWQRDQCAIALLMLDAPAAQPMQHRLLERLEAFPGWVPSTIDVRDRFRLAPVLEAATHRSDPQIGYLFENLCVSPSPVERRLDAACARAGVVIKQINAAEDGAMREMDRRFARERRRVVLRWYGLFAVDLIASIMLVVGIWRTRESGRLSGLLALVVGIAATIAISGWICQGVSGPLARIGATLITFGVLVAGLFGSGLAAMVPSLRRRGAFLFAAIQLFAAIGWLYARLSQPWP